MKPWCRLSQSSSVIPWLCLGATHLTISLGMSVCVLLRQVVLLAQGFEVNFHTPVRFRRIPQALNGRPEPALQEGRSFMSYTDKTLQCSDCNSSFTFRADEQEQLAYGGFVHEPKRCPSCRFARRVELGNSDGRMGHHRTQRAKFPETRVTRGQSPLRPRASSVF